MNGKLNFTLIFWSEQKIKFHKCTHTRTHSTFLCWHYLLLWYLKLFEWHCVECLWVFFNISHSLSFPSSIGTSFAHTKYSSSHKLRPIQAIWKRGTIDSRTAIAPAQLYIFTASTVCIYKFVPYAPPHYIHTIRRIINIFCGLGQMDRTRMWVCRWQQTKYVRNFIIIYVINTMNNR